jgi:hypothetical protein
MVAILLAATSASRSRCPSETADRSYGIMRSC